MLPKLFRASEDQAPSEQARLRLPVDVDPPTDLNEIRTMMRAMPITRVHLQAYGGREHKAAHHAVLGAHGYQYAFVKASRQVSNVVQGPLRW
ncbi:hypothetical protein [Methylobacterium sp. 17Sr1-1]|uniref:hypothetical protein n=1 Tax=Methylobacterium sp. 17Sr1-1 TaxID=2202826 RepID=UPI000D6F6FF4|nr:hypothetical protein [Methylobacterium sp. 17Sr1-1]AWN50726.1 hypothetical protein DK412_02470 [Methylobacterium sp. 17Sr1-1]